MRIRFPVPMISDRRRQSRGQAIVEFALVMPILFVLAFGAWNFWGQYSLSQADARTAQTLAEWIGRKGTYTPAMATAIAGRSYDGVGGDAPVGSDCSAVGFAGTGKPHVYIELLQSTLDAQGSPLPVSGMHLGETRPAAIPDDTCTEPKPVNDGWTPSGNWTSFWETPSSGAYIKVTVWQYQISPLPLLDIVPFTSHAFRRVTSGTAIMPVVRQLAPAPPSAFPTVAP